MSERETRAFLRPAIARHRGHDAATGAPKSDLVAADDYVAFCEGLRTLNGIDLSQYKRPQMERRLRSFFARLGYTKLTDALDRVRADKQLLDELLDRVTINVSQLWRHPDQWARLEGGLLKELAVERPRARLERRLLLRSRGLHARRGLQPGDPRGPGPDRRHRHRPADGGPGQGRRVQRRGRPQRPLRRDAALVRAHRYGLAGQAGAASDDPLRGRRPAQAPAAGVEL